MNVTLDLIERFHEKWQLNPATNCWEWTAAKMGKGYGAISRRGERQKLYAHRLSYLMFHGEIPDGMYVCHTCDNPRCVRPSHLFLGDCGDNLQDMKAKERHLYGERNVKNKLTTEQVRQIHRLHQQGMSTHKIGKTYGISQGQAWRILCGKRWERIYLEMHPRADK